MPLSLILVCAIVPSSTFLRTTLGEGGRRELAPGFKSRRAARTLCIHICPGGARGPNLFHFVC